MLFLYCRMIRQIEYKELLQNVYNCTDIKNKVKNQLFSFEVENDSFVRIYFDDYTIEFGGAFKTDYTYSSLDDGSTSEKYYTATIEIEEVVLIDRDGEEHLIELTSEQMKELSNPVSEFINDEDYN